MSFFNYLHTVDAVSLLVRPGGKLAIWCSGSFPSGLVDLWASDESSNTNEIKTESHAVCSGLASRLH